jgi:hypothetical protein
MYTEDLQIGVTYWVCDYRFSDVRKYVPTRHVKPICVVCEMNPYGDKELKTKKGKVIPIWDKSTSLQGINIFDNESECISHYNDLIEDCSAKLKNYIVVLQADYEKMVKLKI